jgi:hypothetical protein
MNKLTVTALAVASVLALSSCRSEFQNQVRRQVQDFAGATQYITVYSNNGQAVFNGDVDGKVTRAEKGEGGEGGEYIYWYNKKNQYYQSNMPYVVTSDTTREGFGSGVVKP